MLLADLRLLVSYKKNVFLKFDIIIFWNNLAKHGDHFTIKGN